MKARLIYFLKQYVFWILLFVLQKPIFMLWQYPLLGEVEAIDWLLVPWHGLALDLSVASYIMMVVGLSLCVSCWVRWEIIEKVLNIISGILLAVVLWTMLGDNGCFPSWGYHLNKDIFAYLASPKEALACAPWWVWALGIAAFGVLYVMCGWMYLWWMKRGQMASLPEVRWLRCRIIDTIVLLLLTGALFLPMRGSVTVSTMNTGRVYFSDNRMLNIAAINPVFNVIESLSEDHFSSAKYRYMDAAAACAIHRQMVQGQDIKMDSTLFTTSRPRIVLIILESFSMNAMQDGAMPRLHALSKEGIFFANTYAASYRTDRGVMAVLGAFPGCASSSLMLIPSKSGKLPQVGQVLKKEGYQLKFYYGGDEDFTNMRSYLIIGGFEQRVADRDFPLSDRMSKWGVPDHIVFARAAKEISHRSLGTAPSLDVVLSLSSHEPFEVPFHRLENEYLNAIAYTDSCLGALVDTLRLSPVWDSTLVIMMADHGYPYPSTVQGSSPQHHHIPMVIAGGAVRQARTIATCCQQIDWVPTVLHQMGIDASQFAFAKDILNPSIAPFAYYHFVDGFALIKDSAVVVYDADAQQVIQGKDTANNLTEAKAWTQCIMETIDQL